MTESNNETPIPLPWDGCVLTQTAVREIRRLMAVEAMIEAKNQRIEELEERLEITFEWGCDFENEEIFVKHPIPPEERKIGCLDGIAARDVTIALLNDVLKERTETIEELRQIIAKSD